MDPCAKERERERERERGGGGSVTNVLLIPIAKSFNVEEETPSWGWHDQHCGYQGEDYQLPID